MLPFSQACENNKKPILDHLRGYLKAPIRVWEIGSGTGQHAAYFSEQLPHIRWQPTDLPAALPGIAQWRATVATDNFLPALALDVTMGDWPTDEMSAVYTANTIHIISAAAVKNLFEGVGARLVPEGLFFTYGPFLYDGSYTSESNESFDQWLKERDPHSGIKAIETLKAHASEFDMVLIKDHGMPANNQLLVWQKLATKK